MAHSESARDLAQTWHTSRWQSILLGLVLMLAGVFVLRNAVAATVVSAIVFGVTLLVTGLFEIVQSFWAPYWSHRFWRLLLGALYAVGGGILVADPLAASVLLTLVFAAALIASGIARIYVAITERDRFSGLLLMSGIVAVLAGLVILAKWPLAGLWVFGLVVGIDLLVHGLWWLVSGLFGAARHRRAIVTRLRKGLLAVQNDPNAEPNAMTATSATIAPTMPTMTISKIALAMRRAADGEQRHDRAVVRQAVERAGADHGDAMHQRRDRCLPRRRAA